MLLAVCIDRCSEGMELELPEKLLLRASGASLVGIVTAPINYVGVIQRCQSTLPGLLAPWPLWETVRNLPWRGSFYQFLVFGGILMLHIKLVQLKIELKEEDAE